MKRVSFKVAKALKEVGYPQEFPETIGLSLEEKNSEEVGCYFYKSYVYDISLLKQANIIYLACPTYLEVWLWLWQEKKIWIEILNVSGSFLAFINKKPFGELIYNTPEEAIIEAIEYLVENNLINNYGTVQKETSYY